MRLHRLGLQAVGPFPGRHTIDIDALGASGLFLLQGPTGSGKTTLIDAIVFALYGDVADAGGSHRSRMHSQHAEPGVEPVVDLVFSTARGVYRVRRTPAFERPKLRGTGTTSVNTTARLWRLASVDLTDVPLGEEPAGEQISAHVQEVGVELGAILGLDKGQFTQTVVLPQGQFARFLRAGVAERQEVLQQIFATHLYEDVQADLRARALDARRAAQDAAQAAGRRATVVAEHGRVDDDVRTELVAGAEAIDATSVESIVGPLLEGLRAARAEAEAELTRARGADRAAQDALDAERRLARAVARRTALVAEQETLAVQAEGVASDRASLASDTLARPVVVALDAADRAETAATDARDHLIDLAGRTTDEDATDASAGADAHLAEGLAADARAEDVDTLRAHADRLDAARASATSEQGRLSALLAIEAGLSARKERIESDAAEVTALEQELARRTELIDSLPGVRANLLRQRKEAQEVASGLSGARAAAAWADDRLAAARLAARRRTEVAGAEEVLDRARTAAEAAQAAENELRHRWREQVAGRLAGDLQPGAPCPVCGSIEHPSPAPVLDEPVGDEEIEAAENARTAGDRALTDAASALTAAREQLAAAVESADGRTVEAAEAARTEARAAVAAAEDRAAEVTRLDRALTEHDGRAERESAAHAAEVARRAALTVSLESLRSSLAQDETAVAGARGSHGSVAERSAALAARAAAARSLAEAITAVVGRLATAADAAAAATDRLEPSPFADATAARAAVLTDGERAAAERRVSVHAAGTERVVAGLAEEDVAALTGEEVADPDAAESVRLAAAEVLERATAAHGAAERSAGDTEAAVEALRRELAAHAERAAADAPLLRVADLAAGRDSRTGVTLATYVLLRRFEEVLDAANLRLTAMSSGRYLLQRTDDREEGVRTRAVGLGLQVLDTQTDAPRATRTLSGGESFYVSLSLALGLADVVSAESGGIELGTLFIDEGFGTLDPDTLDAVMDELDALRDGGRTVGLVSHVGELRQRIPDRVEVRHLPDGAGSTLTVRAGTGA